MVSGTSLSSGYNGLHSLRARGGLVEALVAVVIYQFIVFVMFKLRDSIWAFLGFNEYWVGKTIDVWLWI